MSAATATPTPRPEQRPRPPFVLLLLAVVGVAVVAVPLIGLAWRTPWSGLADVIGRDVVLDAIRVSILSSVAAALISITLGVPLAWLLARHDFRGRHLVRAFLGPALRAVPNLE